MTIQRMTYENIPKGHQAIWEYSIFDSHHFLVTLKIYKLNMSCISKPHQLVFKRVAKVDISKKVNGMMQEAKRMLANDNKKGSVT